MNVELSEIRIPNYPSGSYNFIRRLRHEKELTSVPDAKHGVDTAAPTVPDDSLPPEEQACLTMDVAIIGAGVGGLATAIALQRRGHRVRIYEQAAALGEIGAGIQIPPNSTRILHSWGLKPALEQYSVTPTSLIWRRWEDGSVIGVANMNPESTEKFGSPYYVAHRAHLHQVLHQAAVDLGVDIHLNKMVVQYGVEDGWVILEGGLRIEADLIVAADGLKSGARSALNGTDDKGPFSHGLSAYRGTISTADISKDPQVKWVMDQPNLNMWVGHDRHVMSYSITSGEKYNMVITHPETSGSTPGASMVQTLEEMRAYYSGWDPSLRRLLDMLDSVVDWPIRSIDIPATWTSKSGKFAITGDAAHAMVPYMALGAAMAVEDAEAMALALQKIRQREELPRAMSLWQRARAPRVRIVHEASFANGLILHIPDGLVQRARDEAMKAEVEGISFTESANQWADPVFKEWAYRYDPSQEIERLWTQEMRDHS